MQESNSPVITSKQNQDAQMLSSKLEDAAVRKRAYVDFTGAMFAVNYLCNLGFRTNTAKSLFNSTRLYSDFQITDIYSNAHTIYVITVYGNETLRIPSLHKKYNILPEVYLIVELKVGMKEAEVKGVVFPDALNLLEDDGKNFIIPDDKIQNIEKLTEMLKKYGGIKPSIGRHLDCMNLFVPYIDGTITEKDKISLIEHILTCETCKKRLIETIEFDKTAKTVQNHENILSKEDLSTKSDFLKKIQTSIQTDTELKGAIDVIYSDKKFNNLENENFIEFRPAIPKKLVKIGLAVMAVFILLIFVPVMVLSLPRGASNAGKNVQGGVLEETTNFDDNFSDNYDVQVPKTLEHKGYTAVSKVSWEVSTNIEDDNQKNFLQQAGKSVKLNLQNDLLLSNEVAIKNKIKFDIKFLRDGSLEDVTLAESSGTNAVDEIIKQSVSNTLRYMRAPKGAFVGNRSGLTLVVEL